MKRIIRKIGRRIIPQKYRALIGRTYITFISLIPLLIRIIQDKFLHFKIKLYIKRRKIYCPKTYPDNADPPSALETLDSVILNKLSLLQFKTSSKEAKFLVVDTRKYGVGAAVLGTLSKGLIHAYLYDRTLLINDESLIYDFCYEPISIHSLKEINKEYAEKAVQFNSLAQKEKIVHASLLQIFNCPYVAELLNAVHPLTLPAKSYYIRGLILENFLQLKQSYKSHIEEKRKEIGFKNPIIGVHIRQATLNNRYEQHRFFSIQTYLEVVEQVVHKTGIKTVFVTTDSEEAIRQLPQNSGIDFIYDDKEKRYHDVVAYVLLKHPELKAEETMTAIKNIYLLADCDYIIGAPGNWFDHSLSLSYFRNKKLNGILIKKHGVIIKRGKEHRIHYRTKDGTDNYDIEYIISNDNNFQPTKLEFSENPFFY